MKVKFTSRKTDLHDRTKADLEKKISRLDKYFGADHEAKVVIDSFKNYEKIEVTIIKGKTVFRAESEDIELYNALDQCIDKLTKQIRKNKTRLSRKGNDTIRYEAVEAYTDEEIQENPMELQIPTIVRRKQLEYTPMTEEEAILQLDLIDHNFFVFHNVDTDAISIVYKRRDGNFGIIEQAE